MPAPLDDLNRDHQCHYYQAPSGQRCGSPALKGEYYCYHHHLKHAKRSQNRVLIDPEITCMEIPPIEDRSSIFIALAAVVHRLAENTIDTRRAGQMIYGLQVAMQALPPRPVQTARTQASAADQPSSASPDAETPAPPVTIPISKEGLLYFLRSRHCAHCNAELFPAHELTERRNAGARPEVIEEAHQALTDLPSILLNGPPRLTQANQPAALGAPKDPGAPPSPQATVGIPPLPSPNETPTPAPDTILPTLQAVAAPTRHRIPARPAGHKSTNRHHSPTRSVENNTKCRSTTNCWFALHSPRRSVSLRLAHMARRSPAPHTTGPQRILNQKANRRKKWQQ